MKLGFDSSVMQPRWLTHRGHPHHSTTGMCLAGPTGGRVWRTPSCQQVAGERPAKEERTQRKRMQTNGEEDLGQQFRELPVKQGFAETG